jgi:FkbM family methyltransferase
MILSRLRETVSSLSTTARFISEHPIARRDRKAAFGRWLRWQLGARLIPGRVVVPFVDDTVLVVEPGMTGATGAVYVGLHEFDDMAFVIHFLRDGDRFLDIGANVGTYSVLAGGVCGARGFAVEPVRTTFGRLAMNLRANGLETKVWACNVALGRVQGKVAFTTGLGAMNHVASAGEAAGTVDVDVTTVDALVGDARPRLVKIDVEGFEAEVLAGGRATFEAPEVEVVIVELNGSGARYGFDEASTQSRVDAAPKRRVLGIDL